MNAIAKQAIARSVIQGEIVTIEYDQAAHHELASQAENYVETESLTEFWGMADGRDAWRVHMRIAKENNLVLVPFFGAWRLGWECEEGFELLGARTDLAALTSPPSPSYRGFQPGDVVRWTAERAALRLGVEPAKDSCGYIWNDKFEAEAALQAISAFF